MKNQNTKTGNSILLSLAALFTLTASAATGVSAQTLPKGSYQQTCKSIATGFEKQNLTVYAECRTKAGGYGPQTKLERYYLCDGDIWNNDGKLGCNINENLPSHQHAKKIIPEAQQMVFGIPNEGTVDYWIGRLLTSGKLDSAYYNTSPETKNAFLSLMKKDFYSGGKFVREKVIKRMSLAVHGRELPHLLTGYDQKLQAGEIGYQDLVAMEAAEMNKDVFMRRAMINYVYRDAMGRNAKKADMDYWLPRKEIYQEILDAARNYLYSDAGADDLRETARDAYKVNHNGKDPSDAELSGMVNLLKATGKKLTHEEMIGPTP